MMNKKILIIVFFIGICFLGLNSNVYASENEQLSPQIYMSKVIEDGIYYIAYSQNTDYVLGVKGASFGNDVGLELQNRNKEISQKFYIQYAGKGYYKIDNISSSKTIEVRGASKESGTQIQQYDDNGSSAQRFKIRKNIDGTYSFIAECSGKAIDISNGVITTGTPIQQYEYNNSYAQRFRLESTEIFDNNVNNTIMCIKTKGDTSKQLDIENCSAQEGAKVQLWTQAPTLAQRFQIQIVGKDEVRIRTAASGGYLKESKKEKGSSVVQVGNSSSKPKNSDIWKVEYDKGIMFINKESGLVLTVNGDYVDGAKVEVNIKTNEEKQRFIVRPIDLIATEYYKIETSSGIFMEVDNAGTAAGTNISAAKKHSGNSQVFTIKFEQNGYEIKSPLSGLVVEVANGSKDNGANVQLGNDTDSDWQRWQAEIQDGGYLTFKNISTGLMLNLQENNNINQELENKKDSQKWKITHTQLTDTYIKQDGACYYLDNSGNRTLIARNLGGWDFTDWDYVMKMRQRAIINGSETDWYATIDCDKPCRDIFFHKENGNWVAYAGYYAVQGFITLEGGSRTIPGIHKVGHKFEWSAAGPGYITSYVDFWGSDGSAPHTPENDNSQVFHGSWKRGSSGYSTHGCSAVTLGYSKWIYENMPLRSTVEVVGNATGIPKGADPDMPSDVQVYPIHDPFA